MFRFAEMILRDRCSTSYDLASLVRGRLCLDRLEKLQNALVRGRQLCTQLSMFEGRLAELLRFLMLSTYQKLGSLRCCQVQKLRKSR